MLFHDFLSADILLNTGFTWGGILYFSRNSELCKVKISIAQNAFKSSWHVPQVLSSAERTREGEKNRGELRQIALELLSKVERIREAQREVE